LEDVAVVASHWFSAQTTPKHKAFHVRFCPRVGDKLPHYEPIAYSLKDLTTWRRIHVGLSDFEGLHPENKPEAIHYSQRGYMDQLSSISSVACMGGGYTRPGNFQWS